MIRTLLLALLLSACSVYDTCPVSDASVDAAQDDDSGSDDAGTDPSLDTPREVVSKTQKLVSPKQVFKFNNSWLNQSRDMSAVNRMNACLRSYARTLNSDGIDWNCGYDVSAFCNKNGTRIYLHGCRPNGGGVERCEIGIQVFTAGYCLWNPQLNGSSWSSQHFLSGGATLLASEPGYTNRWTVQ